MGAPVNTAQMLPVTGDHVIFMFALGLGVLLFGLGASLFAKVIGRMRHH